MAEQDDGAGAIQLSAIQLSVEELNNAEDSTFFD